MRRHGWQHPLHPLQIAGTIIYSFLVVTFYTFLGFFIGNVNAQVTVIAIYSISAASVMFLFIRVTAIDPTDKTHLRKNRKPKSNRVLKLNYGFVLGQIILRFFRRVERYILRAFIRRKYLRYWSASIHEEPLLPFPLLVKDDMLATNVKLEDTSFCVLCNVEVKKNSKHCRTCDRCVEGFDHHCRWLNNCVGKRNYTTFFLLMISVLLMLLIQGGAAIAVFVRCFADKRAIQQELERMFGFGFPRGFLAAISVLLVFLTVYGSAAMGQLFSFHVVLIQKGIRTYDYIMAMKEEFQSMEVDSFGDSDFSSDYSSDSDSPEKETDLSETISNSCSENPVGSMKRLSIKIDRGLRPTVMKMQGSQASINPWDLMKMSKEKALAAGEKAREMFVLPKKLENGSGPLKPLPLEMRSGPLMVSSPNMAGGNLELASVLSMKKLSLSPGCYPNPRRRFSISPLPKVLTLAPRKDKIEGDDVF